MMEERERRERVIGNLRDLFDSREPRHEIIWALMGRPDEVVEVSGQEGKSWCRLFGQDNLIVRAWNNAVPNTYDLLVSVQILREEGMPEEYVILGTAVRPGYGGYIALPVYGVTPHGYTHEIDPLNLGSDPVNVYKRAFTEWRIDAQTTPDMTVRVTGGWFIALDGTLKYFSSTNSPTFSAAPASGERYDLVYFDLATETIKIKTGTARAVGFAERPAPEGNTIPLGWVKLQVGDTSITWTMIEDARLMIQPYGPDGYVTPHPLDPSYGYHTGTLSGLHIHVYHENLSNECNGSKTTFYTANRFEPGTLLVLKDRAEQVPGASEDYEEITASDGFTMATAPTGGTKLLVHYLAQKVEI